MKDVLCDDFARRVAETTKKASAGLLMSRSQVLTFLPPKFAAVNHLLTLLKARTPYNHRGLCFGASLTPQTLANINTAFVPENEISPASRN
ncbi:hypothetical protein AAFG07_33675 [Bradyrhizobium sp. B097]|uniref:hypothetical protein n=1 Tax=Bradyrhizobium sp. B097 TaxID=3140244 RepID=UPI00318367BB